MFESTVPYWLNGLNCLRNMLTKAEGHAAENAYDADVLPVSYTHLTLPTIYAV